MRRPARFPILPTVLVGFALAACADDAGFTSEFGPEVPGVSAIVMDATRGGVAGFHLLPPVADFPTPAPSGVFNPSLMPNVVACKIAEPVDLEMTAETPNGTFDSCEPVVPVTVEDDHYEAKWDTNKDDGGVYRVFVTFGSTTEVTLGFVDISLISGGGARRARDDADVGAEVANAGRTIPVKFLIEEVANETLAESFETVLATSPTSELAIFTVPPTGGEFVVPNPFDPFATGGIAGISLPTGWSTGGVPRNLLISCNNGDFCVSGICSDILNQQYEPGEGPLGSAADPTVVAERPLYCEYKFDPPLPGDGSLAGGLTATIGFCQVDDIADGSLTPIHAVNPKTGPLVQIGRNEGTLAGPIFDHTGTTLDPNFTKTAAPSFLDCDEVVVPTIPGGGAFLPFLSPLGNLAQLIGGMFTPARLYGSRFLVRDGGIGATIGSVRTIFGLVELAPPAVVTLWDNGSSSGPLSNTANIALAGAQHLFEDFTVSAGENWLITKIFWEEHDHNTSTYQSTEVLIFDGLPFSDAPVFSQTIVGNRTPNSTGTILVDWDGFDYDITGLSINLPPGTYWIGLNQNFDVQRAGWDNTTGGPDTIDGWRVVNANFPAPGKVNAGGLAFKLFGQQLP